MCTTIATSDTYYIEYGNEKDGNIHLGMGKAQEYLRNFKQGVEKEKRCCISIVCNAF